MSSAPSSDTKFEIGHVLFVDIVGYSKLLISEQSDLVQHLKEMVRGCEQVRAADAAGKLIRLATGDGMALVFRNSPEAPAQCALELARADQQQPELKLRMGIHSGPINEVTDVNDRVNVTGAGINLAQRVMDCGDARHILLSQRVADDLEQYPRWRPLLHELGECEVKHGARLRLVNLYTDELGNPAVPEKLQQAQSTGPTLDETVRTRPTKISFVRRAIFLLIAITLLAIPALIFTPAILKSRRALPAASAPPKSTVAPAIPEKSIAVLPFENLSEEKANAFFADGVQDEILTNLAKIADLKVISRTSVIQYRSGTVRNLREIGKQLGVAFLLEGSVQRAGGKVRVNAQLIDARTDAHLWAQTYDRDLADVFAIQSDIASRIAEQLQAKLAPEEKARITAKPTQNSEAYLLYLQANELAHVAASKQDAFDAAELYDRAIALDSHFALALARASIWNGTIYSMGRQPDRKNRARALADEALRLAPDLGEAHLALGLCYYRIDADYEKARREFAIAGAALPNSSEVLDVSGYIYRRQGRWRDALAVFQRANELDPRAANFDGLPDTLRVLRQWAAATGAYQHGLQLEPQLADGWYGLAYLQFVQSQDPAEATATLGRLPQAMKSKPLTIVAQWDYAMLARDFTAATKAVPNLDRSIAEFPVVEPVQFYEACIAVAQADFERAHGLFEKVRPLHEAGVRDHPDDPIFHAALGKLYALLGQKEDAIREARRAMELCPESKDAVSGPAYATDLAFVYAQTGEVEQAVTLLAHLLTTPAAERITLAHLRLSWEWDPLRKDPRFQKILEGPEPKTVFK
jgi:TolB-like protein/class 3 adenylate cyclase/Flp pilus assembly protein TadD